MEIRIRNTGAIVSEGAFRALHPNSSLPSPLTLDTLDYLGADPVLEAPAPVANPMTHVAMRNGVTQDSLGNWVYAWAVQELSPEVIQANQEKYIEDARESLESFVQTMLDSKAKERNYDGILSACTYATSKNPKFQAEGQACVEWRDAVWDRCYELLGEVLSGQRPVPSTEELQSLLPQLTWPTV